MTLSQFKNSQKRRQFLEKELKIKLSQIEKAHIEDEKSIHCENLIGETTLPLGVAGPIKIRNSKFEIRNYFIPLATTEGALVASINRGCKAVNLSGGARVFIEKRGITRGPVYYTENLEKGFWFLDWLKKNKEKVKKEIEKTSSHLKLLHFKGKVIGPYTFIRFYFDTQEAMGMNMVTIAVNSLNQLIEKETGIKCLSLSGNYCVDKKPAWLNFIEERGFVGLGEVVLSKKIVNQVLKCSSEKIFEVWLVKNIIGSAIAGSLGFNSHFANIVAAFFAATGQDLAHTVEGSLGMTTTKLLTDGNLYISVYLPSIILGIVGGGTKLKIKKEALAITGVKSSEELAEVLIGAVLAGEISLVASLTEGSLAKAHRKLGR